MLIDSSAADPIDALAHRAKKALLIGQPNGQATVLRELALARRQPRVVVIVDKSGMGEIEPRTNPNSEPYPNPNPNPNPNPSQEIAGTGVVPHDAIGNARVLTVEKAEDQAKVMIGSWRTRAPSPNPSPNPRP